MYKSLLSTVAAFAMVPALVAPADAGIIQTLYADADAQTAWVQLLGDTTWYSGDSAMSRMLGAAMVGSTLGIAYHAAAPDQNGYRRFDFLEFRSALGNNFVEAPGRIYSIRAIRPGTTNTWYTEDFGNRGGAVAFVRFNGPSGWPPAGHLAVGASQVETAMSALSRDLPVTYAEGCMYVLLSGGVEPVCNLFDWIQVEQ